MTFNLGIIGYQLITGQKATKAENEEEYLTQIKELGEEAEKKLLRITKDEKLS